jgi:hypothetical protein
MSRKTDFTEGFWEGFTTGAAASIVWLILMLGCTLLISLMFSFIELRWEWAWNSRLGRAGMSVIGLYWAVYIWKTKRDFEIQEVLSEASHD